MNEKRVQFKNNLSYGAITSSSDSEPHHGCLPKEPPPQLRSFRFSPPPSPSGHKLNIVFVGDVERESGTLNHRKSVLECVKSVCNEMEANFVLVEPENFDTSALDYFYDADAAIIDITIEEYRCSLYYHLGVREGFSMKQNIVLIADVLDDCDSDGNYYTSEDNNSTPTPIITAPITHEYAAQIKTTLPNYPLFVYSTKPVGDKTVQYPGSVECYVDQQFIDLSYKPGSDEQMDPSIPDFDDTVDSIGSSLLSDTVITNQILSAGDTMSRKLHNSIDAQYQPLSLNYQLKDALKNLKWQAKAHMKEKFLADLRKAREFYQGDELCKILHKFRRRLDDPNMLNTEIVDQMLISYKEVQDYDSIVQLVEDLLAMPHLSKITSSPQVVFHHAFALNRRGDGDEALEIIKTALAEKEHQTPDSICLCGRIFKDKFMKSGYKDRESLKQAIDWYRRGFKISPNEYAAINLATLLYIAGHDFRSSTELKHVGLVLSNLIGKKGPVHKLEDYWGVATYFEFCLLAKEYSKAIEAAECMFNLKPSKWNLKSTIGNIKLLYEFKPKQSMEQSKNLNCSTSTMQQTEIFQSPEEQIVEFWMDFFIDAVLDPCDKQIRFAALVLEQNKQYMPTYITMNMDAEEKSITISQMCITHLRDLNGCLKPHLWHIKASGVRGISLYKRDERCVYLYVHDNSDDFQIFFPSESIRTRFKSLVLSITGDRSVDISANLKDVDKKINFVYELDKDNNRIVLGRGSKGVVYAAHDLNTQKQIAVKEVPVKNIGEVQPLQEEIRLHSLLRHRNIVQYLGTNQSGTYFRIFMERVPGGSISQILQQRQAPFKEDVIAYYSKQVLDGLQYLHRQKIVHRDIKGDNVLVNTLTDVLKISDFGTCKRLAAINPNTETFAGTVPFMAPELLHRGERGYSMPADIWSFGCTVVEMASGKPPFVEIGNGAQVMFRVGFYKEHPEIPANVSPKCNNFILRCFEPEPEERASCDELLVDPFLADAVRPASLSSTPTSPVDCPGPMFPQHGSSSVYRRSIDQQPPEQQHQQQPMPERRREASVSSSKDAGACDELFDDTDSGSMLDGDDEDGDDENDDDEAGYDGEHSDDVTIKLDFHGLTPSSASTAEANDCLMRNTNHGGSFVCGGHSRFQLTQHNQKLEQENQLLWNKLYNTQKDLQALLKLQISNKLTKIERLKKRAAAMSKIPEGSP